MWNQGGFPARLADQLQARNLFKVFSVVRDERNRMTDCTTRNPKVVVPDRDAFWQRCLDSAERTAKFSIVRDYDDRF